MDLDVVDSLDRAIKLGCGRVGCTLRIVLSVLLDFIIIMFRALSLLTLASAVFASSTLPRSLLLSRELSIRTFTDCPTCLDASNTLQVCLAF